MAKIRRVVLDVLKPHQPNIVPFTEQLTDQEAVIGVTSKLVEIEEKVRTIRVTIEGEDLDMDAIEERINDLGGSIHSVDEVSCGQEVVDDPWLANG